MISLESVNGSFRSNARDRVMLSPAPAPVQDTVGVAWNTYREMDGGTAASTYGLPSC